MWIDDQRAASASQVRDNFLCLSKAERVAVIARLEVRHGSRSPARMFSLFVPPFVLGLGIFFITFMGSVAGSFTVTFLALGASMAIAALVMLVNAGTNAWKKELAVRLRLLYGKGDA